MAHLESLVVVAGHAVYVGHDFSPQRAEDNEAWFLEVGMRGRGRARRCCKAARPKAPKAKPYAHTSTPMYRKRATSSCL